MLTKNEQRVLLRRLEELLENVDSFGWMDQDEEGPSMGKDSDAPGEARKITSQLLAALE